MQYSLCDAFLTELKKYYNCEVGFDWLGLKAIKDNTIYIYFEFGSTELTIAMDYNVDNFPVSQSYSLYVIFKDMNKKLTAYENYKRLMDTETDIIKLLMNVHASNSYSIDRDTTFLKKGVPFNLPQPSYSSRIDFTTN